MNRIKLISLLLIVNLLSLNLLAQKQTTSKDAQIEQKVNALLAKMTLAEKLGQLQQLDGDWGTGEARPEQLELARKGLLGSTLNARGFKGANDLQKSGDAIPSKNPCFTGF